MLTQTDRRGSLAPRPGLLGLGWGQAASGPAVSPVIRVDPWRGHAVFGSTAVNGRTNEYEGLTPGSADEPTFHFDIRPRRVVELPTEVGDEIVTALTVEPTAFRRAVETAAEDGGPTLWAVLDDLQGSIEGEEDWSENVDQYLYGDEDALG